MKTDLRPCFRPPHGNLECSGASLLIQPTSLAASLQVIYSPFLVFRRQPQEHTFCKNQKGSPVRKQYYFRPSPRGLLAWDVDRLVALSRHLPRKHIPLTAIRELDEACAGEDQPLTWRSMLEHMKLIVEADLSFPIILSSNGEVMDGRHRVAKAAWEGRTEIEAVQFDRDPGPDHVGLGPNELPY